MIDVPPQVVSISPYFMKLNKNDFIRYIKEHEYSQSNLGGFTKHQILEKRRIATIMLFPVEETRYNVKIEKNNLVKEPRRINYLDKIIWIYNSIGLLEIIGITSLNNRIIKDAMNNLKNNFNVDIQPSQTLTDDIIEQIIKASNEGEIIIRKIGYYIGVDEDKIKRYEYGFDLVKRLSEINPSNIFAIGGNVRISDILISFHISKNCKVLLYNKVKSPLVWENIFSFLDRFINPNLIIGVTK